MSEAKNLTADQVEIKSEPDESDGSDNGEKEIYKFKCEKCFKEFDKLKYLNAHLTTHNENRSLTCDICSQNFATKNSIRCHMRVHTGEKPYKCHLCDHSFSKSSTRRKHILTHLPDEKKQLSAHPSEICGKVIKNLYNVKEHMAIHTGNKDVKCPICSKSFARKSTLRMHMAAHAAKDRLSKHKKKCLPLKSNASQCDISPKIEIADQVEVKEEHICELCSKGFQYRATLRRHKKKCLPLKSNASQCDISPKTEIADQVEAKDRPKEHICELCSKGFHHRASLMRHKKKCLPLKSNASQCDISPKTEIADQVEVKEEHICELCSKGFQYRATLRRHKKNCLPLKSNASQCDISPKTEIPDQVEAKDRPKEHICELCSKGFHHRSSLWKHKKKCLPLKSNVSQCNISPKTEIAGASRLASGGTRTGKYRTSARQRALKKRNIEKADKSTQIPFSCFIRFDYND